MSVNVRVATPSDAEAVSAIMQQANDFKHSRGDNDWGKLAFTPAEMLEPISLGEIYLANVDEEPAASVRLILNDERVWGHDRGNDNQAVYIHKLAVASKFRGSDLINQMMDWVAGHAMSINRPYLRLDCRASNESLCRYYNRLGFTAVDTLLLPNNYNPALFEKSV